jgi:DNA-binding transcriptional MerR regulator
MEEETKISLEEIEKRIDSYVDRGDWLELKDFLQTQQFEELIEKNTEFQEIILSKLKNLLRIIG